MDIQIPRSNVFRFPVKSYIHSFVDLFKKYWFSTYHTAGSLYARSCAHGQSESSRRIGIPETEGGREVAASKFYGHFLKRFVKRIRN